MFALFKVKIGPSFLFFVFESLVLLAERRFFLKNKKTTKNNHISKLKIGPILLRNIFGAVFNFDLDQFLTLKSCHVCFVVFLLKPLVFFSFLAKYEKLKKHQKRKKTICEHTCANFSCQNVLLFFFSVFFFGICIFERCFDR